MEFSFSLIPSDIFTVGLSCALILRSFKCTARLHKQPRLMTVNSSSPDTSDGLKTGKLHNEEAPIQKFGISTELKHQPDVTDPQFHIIQRSVQ